MLIDNLIPLTVAFGIAAVAMLVGAILARRRIRSAAEGFRRADVVLAERAAMWPIILSTTRADLAERGAAGEQALWTINRFDKQVAEATVALAERRRAIDEMRVKLEGGRANVERVKSALRMIMRALELRRTILG
jgi:hypothetical protein